MAKPRGRKIYVYPPTSQLKKMATKQHIKLASDYYKPVFDWKSYTLFRPTYVSYLLIATKWSMTVKLEL